MNCNLRIWAFCLIFLTLVFGEAMARPVLFEIDPIPDQTAEANRPFQYQVTYTVEDEACWQGEISFVLATEAPGMKITRGGEITWTPNPSLVCEPFMVTVRATATGCNEGIGEDLESFLIDVVAPASVAAFVGPYFHNIHPWDYSSTETGLKLLLDVPPEPPISDVVEYVVKEGKDEKTQREVAIVPPNRTGKLQFVEIDDHPLDYETLYTYELYARLITFEGCKSFVEERKVTHKDKDGNFVSETKSRRTRYLDGVDAREAALQHRPLLVFDASEIYWPINIEWMLANAHLTRYLWGGGPQLTLLRGAGDYTEEEMMDISHQEVGVDFLSFESFHRDAEERNAEEHQGVLLDYEEYYHLQSTHQVDSNNAEHNMGLSPAARDGLPGCEELFGPFLEWYYDCHFDLDDGRDLWDMGGELTTDYRAPNPEWKLYYAVYPYDGNGNGEEDDGEYEIVYQMWNSWDANWEDGDNAPLTGVVGGASEFITRHEGDQTQMRVYTSDHGKTATFVTGGMHGMSLFVVGGEGYIKDRGDTDPQEFKFYGRPVDEMGNQENIFLYEAGVDPYLQSSYQTPDETFRPHAYWNFYHDNPEATHPVMFIGGRSHGSSPIPGVLQSTLKWVTVLPPLMFIDLYIRDAFTGTGLRWFPTEKQLVPIEIDHPAFFHYTGWTGNWNRQERRGKDPGWVREVTPPHSPYNILDPSGGPGDLSGPEPVERRILWWAGGTTKHGPEGPYKWDSATLKNPWFEYGLDSWKTYGGGFVEATTEDAFKGDFSAYVQCDAATGNYFGLYQKDIRVEPETEYRLSLWVRTNATSGSVAAALGVWSADPSRNHHTDFGFIGGTNDWVHISGTWQSRPDENKIQVVLFGRPDFVGEAYFDGLVLEEVIP